MPPARAHVMAKPHQFHTTFDRSIVPTINFINMATLPLDVDFDKLIRTLKTFLDECFVPVWGTPAKLIKGTKLKDRTWTVVFIDDPHSPDADGWHELTKEGFPLAKVFV